MTTNPSSNYTSPSSASATVGGGGVRDKLQSEIETTLKKTRLHEVSFDVCTFKHVCVCCIKVVEEGRAARLSIVQVPDFPLTRHNGRYVAVFFYICAAEGPR